MQQLCIPTHSSCQLVSCSELSLKLLCPQRCTNAQLVLPAVPGWSALPALNRSCAPPLVRSGPHPCLPTGASLGPEGPSVDIGKSFAKGFSTTLRSKQRHLTSLIAAGAGAGVAAGFNAPIAGAGQGRCQGYYWNGLGGG